MGSSTPNCLAYSRVQSLPAAELHGVRADHASNRRTGQRPIEHVEADVPAGRAHRDESTIDVVPQREPGAAALRLQLPANVLSAPVELQQLRRVGPLDLAVGDERRRCAHGRQLRGAHGPQAPVRIEGGPFAQMLGFGERLPDLGGRVAQVADQNERPFVSLFSNLGAGCGAGRVFVAAAHGLFFPFFAEVFAGSSLASSLSEACRPSGPGVAPGRRRASTRSGGRGPARRRAP